tara:strand:- start:41 stop:331 length:291 start_codon:yes stop_codon:yes gene_type:complete
MTDLFTFAAARGKTDTSEQAADAIDPHAPDLRSRVYRHIKRHSFGKTTSELTEDLGHQYSGIQPRTSELREKGLIKDSGERRKNRGGRNEIVWMAV